jgi:hypothetical protein
MPSNYGTTPSLLAVLANPRQHRLMARTTLLDVTLDNELLAYALFRLLVGVKVIRKWVVEWQQQQMHLAIQKCHEYTYFMLSLMLTKDDREYSTHKCSQYCSQMARPQCKVSEKKYL